MFNKLIGDFLTHEFLLMYVVDALREIGEQLGKKDWNLNENPCDQNNQNWRTAKSSGKPWYNNTVECNCTYPDGVCHVEHMYVFNPKYH